MPSTISHRVLVESVGGVTVASFADAELIADDVIAEVNEQLEALVANLQSTNVLLNFRGVRFMSSSMLAVLLRFARRVSAAQGKVKLCCIATNLMEVFRITRFDKVFDIHTEEAAALDSF